MFGAFLDAAMSIPNNMMMEEDRNQRQQDNWGIQLNTQNFNSAQAAAQREWATELSNTQYQRAATDASKAGLNRILAMRQGGAGVPAGSSASSSGSGGSAGTPGSIHSNFAAAQVMEDQKDLMHAQKITTDQQAYNYSADTEKKKQESNLLMEQQKYQREATRREKSQADIATSDAKGRALEGNIDSTTYGNIMRYIDRAMRGITGSGSAYGNFTR